MFTWSTSGMAKKEKSAYFQKPTQIRSLDLIPTSKMPPSVVIPVKYVAGTS